MNEERTIVGLEIDSGDNLKAKYRYNLNQTVFTKGMMLNLLEDM